MGGCARCTAHRTGPGRSSCGIDWRVRHPVAFENFEILVDNQQIVFGDLVEAQSQPLGVVRTRLLRTGGDLARQPGIVAGVEQGSAGQGQFLPRRQGGILDMGRQPIERPLHQDLFRITKRGRHLGMPFYAEGPATQLRL